MDGFFDLDAILMNSIEVTKRRDQEVKQKSKEKFGSISSSYVLGGKLAAYAGFSVDCPSAHAQFELCTLHTYSVKMPL